MATGSRSRWAQKSYPITPVPTAPPVAPAPTYQPYRPPAQGALGIKPKNDNGFLQQVHPQNLQGISQHLQAVMQNPEAMAAFGKFVQMWRAAQAQRAQSRPSVTYSRSAQYR